LSIILKVQQQNAYACEHQMLKNQLPNPGLSYAPWC